MTADDDSPLRPEQAGPADSSTTRRLSVNMYTYQQPVSYRPGITGDRRQPEREPESNLRPPVRASAEVVGTRPCYGIVGYLPAAAW